MRRLRLRPPVVAALLVFVVAVVWLAVAGWPVNRYLPLKRDPRGVLHAEQFTPQEYLRFRAEYPSGQNPLDEYLRQAVEAGREADAIQSVNPDERATAGEQLTFAPISKADWGRYPKDEVKHGPVIRRLRELRPHLAEPHTSIVDAFLLFCNGEFEQAETAFAALPPDYQGGPFHKRRAIYQFRLAGFQQRGAWREAYKTLEPRRVAFQQLGFRWIFRPEPSAEHEELIRLHRESDPDDILLLYHEAFLRFNQKRYAEVVELAAKYESRPVDVHDEQLGFATPIVDLRYRRAFSLAMLERYTEAEAMDGQLTFTAGNQPMTILRDIVRLSIALKRGDAEKAGQVLASSKDLPAFAHTDPHLAPLFAAETFAGLRKKYPPPEKTKK